MRECKKCFKVKKDNKFFTYVINQDVDPEYIVTWLCKECAKECSEEIIKREAEKFNPKL